MSTSNFVTYQEPGSEYVFFPPYEAKVNTPRKPRQTGHSSWPSFFSRCTSSSSVDRTKNQDEDEQDLTRGTSFDVSSLGSPEKTHESSVGCEYFARLCGEDVVEVVCQVEAEEEFREEQEAKEGRGERLDRHLDIFFNNSDGWMDPDLEVDDDEEGHVSFKCLKKKSKATSPSFVQKMLTGIWPSTSSSSSSLTRKRKTGRLSLILT